MRSVHLEVDQMRQTSKCNNDTTTLIDQFVKETFLNKIFIPKTINNFF